MVFKGLLLKGIFISINPQISISYWVYLGHMVPRLLSFSHSHSHSRSWSSIYSITFPTNREILYPKRVNIILILKQSDQQTDIAR